MALFSASLVVLAANGACGKPAPLTPVDYGRSFICTLGPGNSPVFWLESRLRISDPAAGITRDYYQCASCKSENTFPPRGMLKDPNYDFMPIFSADQTLVFRRHAQCTDGYRSITGPMWGGMQPRLRRGQWRALISNDEIVAAIRDCVPMVAQTELRDPENGRVALIEYPIKTMNWDAARNVWQVDTGPVLLPDLKLPPEKWLEGIQLAFVVFNAPDWAEFVVEQPTPVGEGGDGLQVYHYSGIRAFEARNTLFAEDLGEDCAPEVITEEGVRKVRLLPPGPGNPRNSEGDFIQLRDGRILFVYSHFTGGGADDSAAYLAGRYSSDGGLSWTDHDVTILPNEGKRNVMSVSLLRLQSGEIALFYLRKNAADDCRAYMRLSTDEGQTWSDAVLCIPDEGYYVVNNDRVVQLASGRLVIPAARHTLPGGAFRPRGVAMCYLSDDNGKTWRKSRSELEGPGGSASGLQEPGVIELKDGRLMMLCRTDQGCQYRSYSGDGGETWSPAEPTDLKSPCSPATFERIPHTGEILLVWNDHSDAPPALAGKRTPLRMALSGDEGQTWQRVKTLEDDPDGWFCYTALEFVGDRVLLAYCATGKDLPHLSRTQITVAELNWVVK